MILNWSYQLASRNMYGIWKCSLQNEKKKSQSMRWDLREVGSLCSFVPCCHCGQTS